MKKFKVFSLLDIRNVNEEQRVIEGIASTPTPDRMGDVVEPLGVKFKTPLPLLLAHDSEKTVGNVTFAKPTKDGIPFRAVIPKVTEEGILRDRVEEAWQSVKYGVLRAVSIGFRVLNDGAELLKDGGIRFTDWEWLELSLVSVPAQPDAVIHSFKSMDPQSIHRVLGTKPSDDELRTQLLKTIKSADREALAASGLVRKSMVVRLDQPPGASGKKTTPIIPEKTDMRTIKEQIEALEAKRAASSARRDAVQQKALEEGRTKDTAEKEEFDTLSTEIDSIDAELKDLRVMERQAAASAVVVQRHVGSDPAAGAAARDPNPAQRANAGGSGVTFVRSNQLPGIGFTRYAMACVRAAINRRGVMEEIEADKRWMRETPELMVYAKNAIAAGDTTTAGWASELAYAQNLASEFIEYLRPMTILGKIGNFRRVPFNIRVGGLSGGTTGYWVGQGAAIPVSKGTSTSVSLGIAKAAGITAIDNELARLSSPSAELMVRNDLAKAIVYLMDDTFINPNNGGITNVKPASMLYGVTPVTPTGTTYAAMRTDLQSMMETALDAHLDTEGSVFIMSATLALKLSMMVNALDQLVNPKLSVKGGEFQGFEAIVSQVAQIAGSPQYNDVLVWLHPQEVFFADDGQVSVEASKEASLELLDNPTNLSTGATAATSMVSMYQTESMAIKAVRYLNWTKRRSTAAQWIQNAAYTG